MYLWGFTILGLPSFLIKVLTIRESCSWGVYFRVPQPIFVNPVLRFYIYLLVAFLASTNLWKGSGFKVYPKAPM